jgi:hypothetical protein
MVTMARLSSLFADVEKHHDKVLVVWLHPYEYAELRSGNRDHIGIEMDRERLKAGFRGFLWGATIREDAKHSIYLETEHGTNPRPSRWDIVGE